MTKYEITAIHPVTKRTLVLETVDGLAKASRRCRYWSEHQGCARVREPGSDRSVLVFSYGNRVSGR
jgi:hypothetical protein